MLISLSRCLQSVHLEGYQLPITQETAIRRHCRQSVTVPIISSASAAWKAGPGYYEAK